MSDQIGRLVAEAIKTKRPVLVNPSEDEIRQTAEELRQEGKLICTACREPIAQPEYVTRKLSLGPRLQAVAHLHEACARDFVTDADEQEEDE